MDKYEYRVVPAPAKAKRMRGVKATSDRFAATIETLMNELGNEGWEYLRADTLPVEERSGIASKTTVFQNMLVFRRLQNWVVETPSGNQTNASAQPASLPVPKPLPSPRVRTTLPEFLERRRALPPPHLVITEPSDEVVSNEKLDAAKNAVNPALAARAAMVRAQKTAAE